MRRTAGERAVAGGVDAGSPRSAPVATGEAFSSGFASFFFSCRTSFGVTSFFCFCCFESSITATTSPIFTSWPSGTFVSSTPDFSATISVETLSVSRAKSGSPSFTNSPDFLCQAETTPLVTDSPTDGILTSIIIVKTRKLIERRGRGGFRQNRVIPGLQRPLSSADIIAQCAEDSALYNLRAGAGIMPQSKLPKRSGEPKHNRRRDNQMQHQRNRLSERFDEQTRGNIRNNDHRNHPPKNQPEQPRKNHIRITRDVEEVEIAINQPLCAHDPKASRGQTEHNGIMHGDPETNRHEIQ